MVAHDRETSRDVLPSFYGSNKVRGSQKHDGQRDFEFGMKSWVVAYD